MSTHRATMALATTIGTILAMLWVGGNAARAEVSVGMEGSATSFLLATGGDDPTPYPWGRVRLDAPLTWLLEPDASAAENGAVDFAFDPVAGRHEVVWARFDGNDFEIVRSYWDGSAWSPAEQVTDNSVDDLDPALSFTSTGKRMITWWREGADRQIWFREKSAGASWTGEQVVTTLPETGSHPAVAAFGDGARIVYQTPGASGTEISIASQDTGWSSTLIAQTPYEGPAGDGVIHARIHSRTGRLWVDWIDGLGRMAYSVYDDETGSWSAPKIENYSWDPGMGETEYWAREGARVRIALAVLR